jgi:hypothetical protein
MDLKQDLDDSTTDLLECVLHRDSFLGLKRGTSDEGTTVQGDEGPARFERYRNEDDARRRVARSPRSDRLAIRSTLRRRVARSPFGPMSQ